MDSCCHHKPFDKILQQLEKSLFIYLCLCVLHWSQIRTLRPHSHKIWHSAATTCQHNCLLFWKTPAHHTTCTFRGTRKRNLSSGWAPGVCLFLLAPPHSPPIISWPSPLPPPPPPSLSCRCPHIPPWLYPYLTTPSPPPSFPLLPEEQMGSNPRGWRVCVCVVGVLYLTGGKGVTLCVTCQSVCVRVCVQFLLLTLFWIFLWNTCPKIPQSNSYWKPIHVHTEYCRMYLHNFHFSLFSLAPKIYFTLYFLSMHPIFSHSIIHLWVFVPTCSQPQLL